jgi:hypothetical protein
MGDVNAEGKSDAVACDEGEGTWTVALAANRGYPQRAEWPRDFGPGADFGFISDVDGAISLYP